MRSCITFALQLPAVTLKTEDLRKIENFGEGE